MKIGIIGAGFVGSTTAYTLAVKNLAREIVLVDINRDKAEAEALDVLHAAAFNAGCRIYNGSYPDLKGAGIVIITVDSQKTLTDSRMALLESNTKIMQSIIPQIVGNAPECIILIATNPVDVITKIVLKLSGFPQEKVIGSGTVLDTARFRSVLSGYFNVSPRSIHAYVMGEHGSSSLVSWSTATIGGSDIKEYAERLGKPLSDEFKQQTTKDIIEVGFRIYHGKKATYYGIASSLVTICEAIVKDEERDLTVSTLHHEVAGIRDVCLSLPTIVDRRGAHDAAVPSLGETEMRELRRSAEILRQASREAEELIK